jgi:hypothetical protein
MTIYKSKLGIGLVISLAIILGSITVLFLYIKIFLAFAFLLFIDIFIIHMFATTYYQLDQFNLRIKCGFFYDKTISIYSIKNISETSIASSSPATSFDRLQLLFNVSDSVIISPKDKTSFINQITTLNPAIKIAINND